MATRAIVTGELRGATILEGQAQPASQSLPHPVALATMSGCLLWLSFPPAEWSWSAWVALVPLFFLIPSRRSPASLYLGSWLGGFVFWFLSIHWIWWTDESAWLGWVVMALALSFWWPGFLFLARFATQKLGLPVMLSAPIFWVALEYLRAYVLTGFPWYYLAHSQYRQVYLTQIADFSGALGLSFLIAMTNAFVVELATRPLFRLGPGPMNWVRLVRGQKARIVVMVVGIVGTLAYGAFRVSTARFRPGPRIAMIQSGEFQSMDPAKRKSSATLRGLYESLAVKAARFKLRPDLIVWPETSYPFGHVRVDPKLTPEALDRQAKEIDPDGLGSFWKTRGGDIAADIARLMESVRVPMMIGATTHDFRVSGYSRYNSALLFQAGRELQTYHKLHLVPFGEYVPLLKTLPWLIRLTPFQGTNLHFLDHGADLAWFDLGPYRLAAAICFEDTIPQVVRRFFSEAPGGRKPDLLVNLSNDGWFGQTSEHEMHLAVSIFRCIENRVPLARAVNTGISAMIDGNGRIVRSLAKTTVDVLVAEAPLDDRVSLYSRFGDWLGQFCAAATIGIVILGRFAPRKRPGGPTIAT